MNRTARTNIVLSRPGFSMVEVLIAILILGLGLLGLAAVFPVVISEQRRSIEAVEGEAAASTAEAVLRASPDIFELPAQWFNPDPTVLGNTFGKANAGDQFFTYEWVVPPFEPYDSYPVRPGFGPGVGFSSDGVWYSDLATSGSVNFSDFDDMDKFLTVADRLIPRAYSGKAPQYVWDVVLRRRPGANKPQIALFIRRVDARIKVPNGVALDDVLVRGVDGGDPVLPVSIDLTTGQPVVDDGQNGDFVYASPQTLNVQVFKDQLDWLVFENAGDPLIDTSISFATRPGQLLVDNTGTVRRVLGPVTEPDAQIEETVIVRVDPPFQTAHGARRLSDTAYSENNNEPGTTNPPTATENAQRASWVRQVVFTPRTPVSVRIINPEDPS